mgnify:CR=1 FL=1
MWRREEWSFSLRAGLLRNLFGGGKTKLPLRLRYLLELTRVIKPAIWTGAAISVTARTSSAARTKSLPSSWRSIKMSKRTVGIATLLSISAWSSATIIISVVASSCMGARIIENYRSIKEVHLPAKQLSFSLVRVFQI